jgi:anaerobic carbon-monoxide dehydrogenase, CODH/ACS complex subunit epsilon
MAAIEPWQIAEIPGPKKAMVIAKPEVVDAMIKRSKRPVLIVGHLAAEIPTGDKMLIDYLIDLAKNRNIPIIATGKTNFTMMKKGYTDATILTAVDAGKRLTDPVWTGVDGKGPHDLALFAGLPYYMEWNILSGLKHFAPQVRTVTLDNMYHPHASFSFASVPAEEWQKNLETIIGRREG